MMIGKDEHHYESIIDPSNFKPVNTETFTDDKIT